MPSTSTDIIRASIFSTFAWLKNNKWLLFSMLIWPYLITFLMLALGVIYGNLEMYKERLGVSNPVLYILASSGIVMSSLIIVDTVATSALYHRWLGTLPYLLLTPTRTYKVLLLEPIPSAILSSTVSMLAVLPGAILFEGLLGAGKLFLILLVVYLGMLPLIGLSVVVASLTLVLREETNIVAFLTPLILLVSGVFYPIEVLPTVLRSLSNIFPTLYVVQAAKLTATYTIPEVKALLTLISALVILTFIYNGIASLAIGESERMIKKSGVV